MTQTVGRLKGDLHMKKTQRIIGQILLAIGITQAIGGVASFFFEKVELRFIGSIITNETDRIIWVIVNVSLACIGFYLWRASKIKNSAA